MVTLRIVDEEFYETIENVSLENAFSMIADYCFERMLDEPSICDISKKGKTLVIHGDDVVFEIEDYHDVETEIGIINAENGPDEPIIIKTAEDFEAVFWGGG